MCDENKSVVRTVQAGPGDGMTFSTELDSLACGQEKLAISPLNSDFSMKYVSLKMFEIKETSLVIHNNKGSYRMYYLK
jgi:hypothetical protein